MRMNLVRNTLLCLLAVVLFLPYKAVGQVAGLNTLSVLDMSASSRTAGLGMNYLSVWDQDFNVGIENPSLLDRRFDNMLSIRYVGLFAGSNFGSVDYGFKKGKLGTFVAGIRYNSYGRFDGYDETGMQTGHFYAADYALYAAWGMPIDSNYSIGASFSPILSQYEQYTGLAFAMNVGGSYVSDSKRFAATVMARNIGAQILTFDGTTESIPLNLSAAMSYKLENAPFRFYLAANELQRWNLSYENPLHPSTTEDLFTGEVSQMSGVERFGDNLFRHLNVGLELNLGKAFFARLGYSYRKAAETRSIALTSLNTSGFSFGVGFRVKGYDIAYSRNNYYLGKAPNFITITTSLDRFLK